MPRFYINSDEARITKADFNLVDVELIDGTSWKELEPKRLFPPGCCAADLVDAAGEKAAAVIEVQAARRPDEGEAAGRPVMTQGVRTRPALGSRPACAGFRSGKTARRVLPT